MEDFERDSLIWLGAVGLITNLIKEEDFRIQTERNFLGVVDVATPVQSQSEDQQQLDEILYANLPVQADASGLPITLYNYNQTFPLTVDPEDVPQEYLESYVLSLLGINVTATSNYAYPVVTNGAVTGYTMTKDAILAQEMTKSTLYPNPNIPCIMCGLYHTDYRHVAVECVYSTAYMSIELRSTLLDENFTFWLIDGRFLKEPSWPYGLVTVLTFFDLISGTVAICPRCPAPSDTSTKRLTYPESIKKMASLSFKPNNTKNNKLPWTKMLDHMFGCHLGDVCYYLMNDILTNKFLAPFLVTYTNLYDEIHFLNRVATLQFFKEGVTYQGIAFKKEGDAYPLLTPDVHKSILDGALLRYYDAFLKGDIKWRESRQLVGVPNYSKFFLVREMWARTKYRLTWLKPAFLDTVGYDAKRGDIKHRLSQNMALPLPEKGRPLPAVDPKPRSRAMPRGPKTVQAAARTAGILAPPLKRIAMAGDNVLYSSSDPVWQEVKKRVEMYRGTGGGYDLMVGFDNSSVFGTQLYENELVRVMYGGKFKPLDSAGGLAMLKLWSRVLYITSADVGIFGNLRQVSFIKNQDGFIHAIQVFNKPFGSAVADPELGLYNIDMNVNINFDNFLEMVNRNLDGLLNSARLVRRANTYPVWGTTDILFTQQRILRIQLRNGNQLETDSTKMVLQNYIAFLRAVLLRTGENFTAEQTAKINAYPAIIEKMSALDRYSKEPDRMIQINLTPEEPYKISSTVGTVAQMSLVKRGSSSQMNQLGFEQAIPFFVNR